LNKEIFVSEPIIVTVAKDLEALIPRFLANRQKDIATATAALQSSDFDAIRLLGHSIKGVGGSYGFDAISHFGVEFESAALHCDKVKVRDTLLRYQDYLGRVKIHIK
jgi:HPt (histidine-containing phosphotransfer) domain-containing protein